MARWHSSADMNNHLIPTEQPLTERCDHCLSAQDTQSPSRQRCQEQSLLHLTCIVRKQVSVDLQQVELLGQPLSV